MNFSIRDAYETDSRELGEIALAAKKTWDYPDSWYELWDETLGITENFITTNKVVVATINEKPAGFAAVRVNSRVADLEHMWVLPEYMNKGLGTALFREIVDFCRAIDVRKLRIESDPNATGFYKKMGGRQIGYVDSLPKPRKLPVFEIDI